MWHVTSLAFKWQTPTVDPRPENRLSLWTSVLESRIFKVPHNQHTVHLTGKCEELWHQTQCTHAIIQQSRIYQLQHVAIQSTLSSPNTLNSYTKHTFTYMTIQGLHRMARFNIIKIRCTTVLYKKTDFNAGTITEWNHTTSNLKCIQM